MSDLAARKYALIQATSEMDAELKRRGIEGNDLSERINNSGVSAELKSQMHRLREGRNALAHEVELARKMDSQDIAQLETVAYAVGMALGTSEEAREAYEEALREKNQRELEERLRLREEFETRQRLWDEAVAASKQGNLTREQAELLERSNCRYVARVEYQQKDYDRGNALYRFFHKRPEVEDIRHNLGEHEAYFAGIREQTMAE